MNNKGFTVVELLASFTLTMIIMVFLFEIVLQLKEVYITDALRTKIYDKNAIVATTLNDKIESMRKDSTIDGKKIVCDNKECGIIIVDEGGEQTQEIQFMNPPLIEIGDDNKSIIIGEQKIKYPDKINEINNNFQIIPDCDTDANSSCVDEPGVKRYLVINFYVTSDYLDKRIAFNYVKRIS